MKTATKTVSKVDAANAALYAAAEKVGMRDALASANVEVIASCGLLMLTWDRECQENERFVFPRAAFNRASVWLAKYAATVPA